MSGIDPRKGVQACSLDPQLYPLYPMDPLYRPVPLRGPILEELFMYPPW